MRSPTLMPPTPRYSLLPTNEGALGASMRQVEYRRIVGDPDVGIEDSEVDSVDQQRSLRAWLATLGGRDTAQACGRKFEAAVRWTGKWSLRQVIRGQQAEARRAFTGMTRDLLRCGLLQAEEVRELSPGIELILWDKRGDQSQPLPEERWLLGDGR